MLIISTNINLSEKDIEALRNKGIKVITNVNTAYGNDDINEALEEKIDNNAEETE